jgi:hypothetical protein
MQSNVATSPADAHCHAKDELAKDYVRQRQRDMMLKVALAVGLLA